MHVTQPRNPALAPTPSPLPFPRHPLGGAVYVDAPKATDTYSGIRLSTAVGEQNYIKGNPKFFSVALAVRWNERDAGTPCACMHAWQRAAGGPRHGTRTGRTGGQMFR